MGKEEKRLSIPEGYEFDRVENGKVILKKKETVLPKTWEECISSDGYNAITVLSDNESEKAVRALCKLLVCRNAWWEQLGWRPDWTDSGEKKFCITCEGGKIGKAVYNSSNEILAFPTIESMEEFLDAFSELIEEGKGLL